MQAHAVGQHRAIPLVGRTLPVNESKFPQCRERLIEPLTLKTIPTAFGSFSAGF
jgi:hypothetical protein